MTKLKLKLKLECTGAVCMVVQERRARGQFWEAPCCAWVAAVEAVACAVALGQW